MRNDLIYFKINWMVKSIYRNNNLYWFIGIYLFSSFYFVINNYFNDKDKNTFFGFSNAMLFSTVLKISIWEIFDEKKKKFKTFWMQSGFGNLEYYLSYILFGFILLFVSNITLSLLFIVLNKISFNIIFFIIFNILFSLNCIMLYLIISLFFKSQVQGINFISIISLLINWLPSISSIDDHFNTVSFMTMIFPKSVFYNYLYDLKNSANNFRYLIEFIWQFIVYLIILIFIEKKNKNEYEEKNFKLVLKDTFYEIISPFKYIFNKKFFFKYFKNIQNNELMEVQNFSSSNKKIFCEVKNISKQYQNSQNKVLDNLSCNFYFNEIFVVLGHNGAGKTTFINCLLNNLNIDSGNIKYNNFEKSISSCGQENIFWNNIKVSEHIEFFCKIIGKNYKKEINKIEKIFNFKENFQKWAKDWSGGYKRRLSISLSYILDSNGIFWDEPTTSLDLISRNEICEIIKNLRKENKFILMTTHYLEEAESIASKIGIISKGNFYLNDSPNNLKSKFANNLNIEIDIKSNFIKDFFLNTSTNKLDSYTTNQNKIISEIKNLEYKLKQEEKKLIIKISKKEMENQLLLLEKLESENLNFSINTITLEEIFINMGSNKYNDINFNNLKLLNEKNIITIFSLLKFGIKKNYWLIKRENNFFTGLLLFIFLPLLVSVILKNITNDIIDNFSKKYVNISNDMILHFSVVLVWCCSNLNQLMNGILILLEDMSIKYNYILYNKGISTYIYFFTIILFDLLILFVTVSILSFTILQYFDFSFIIYIVLFHYGHTLINYYILTMFKDKKKFWKYFGYITIGIFYLSMILTYLFIIIFFLDDNIKFNYFISLFNPYLILLLKLKNSNPIINEFIKNKLKISKEKEKYFDYDYNTLLMIISNIIFNSIFICYLYNKRFKYKVDKSQSNTFNTNDINLINKREINDEINLMYNDNNLNNTIEIQNVSKIYNKSIIANQNINFCIKKNECLGLWGPNGAGKTTLMSMISKVISTSEGFIKNQGTIGICFQENSLFENMTVNELLSIYISLYNINKSNLEKMMQILEIDIYKNQFIKNLSGGNKRKLSSLICILGKNNLIMMDEPTAGLDPVSRINFTNFIKIIKKKIKNSFWISTHYMREAEIISDKIAILINGQLVSINKLQNYYKLYNKTIIFKFKIVKEDDISNLINILNNNFEKKNIIVENEINNWWTVRITNIKFSEIIKCCVKLLKENWISDFLISKGSLEQVFLKYCKYQKNN